jgi:hypothetical protein
MNRWALDLDLDFFVSPTLFDREEHLGRPANDGFTVWPSVKADGLLRKLGLTGTLPGKVCGRHVEALWAWREAIRLGALVPPFPVVHVDAHEDLG